MSPPLAKGTPSLGLAPQGRAGVLLLYLDHLIEGTLALPGRLRRLSLATAMLGEGSKGNTFFKPFTLRCCKKCENNLKGSSPVLLIASIY